MDKAGVLEATLDSLAHLLVGTDDRPRVMWTKASITSFDGFEIMDRHLSDAEDFVLFSEPGDAPVWPMDAVWALRLEKEINIQGADGWAFKRVKTLNPREWRGKITSVFPRMIEHHEHWVSPDGKAMGSVAPLALLKDRLVAVGARSHPLAGMAVDHKNLFERSKGPGYTEFEKHDVGFAHGVMLRREYLWSVLLGEPGIPRARFVTDPLGVREVFRLRDIPPGRARRAALRHWVRQHWRKTGRDSEDDRAWVRAHLRGAADFAWNGFSCRIEPSREDLRRNQPLGTNRASPRKTTTKAA